MMSATTITGLRSMVSRTVPLCMSLLATALILQDAHGLRCEEIADDEVITSLISWIHPAAIVALAFAYALSFFVILAGRSKSEKDRTAGEA